MKKKRATDELNSIHDAIYKMRGPKATLKSSTKASSVSDARMVEGIRAGRVAITLGDIYQMALRHYEVLCPERNALPTVAAIIGISEKKLYRATVNEATLDTHEEGQLFVTTVFPQAFEMKRNLLFPQLTVQTP